MIGPAMNPFQRTYESFRSWLEKPQHDLPQRQRTARWWVDLARHGVAELRRDRASQMAAALSYHTLFSLLPTAVLVLIALHAFVGDAERAEFKQTVVTWMLTPIRFEGMPGEPVGVDSTRGETEGEAVGPELGRRREFERVRASLGERVEGIIDTLESVDFRSIGVAGLLLFLYATTGLLATIERSFNTVYGAAQARPPHIRFPIYYTVISVGPLVLLGSQVLRREFLRTVEGGTLPSWLFGAMGAAAPFLASWLVLWLIYVLLPNTRVRRRLAAVGSFVAALLWVAGLHLFSVYVRRAAVTTLYGALGLLPLFLFWMWITWLIVLFGLELTYTLQAMREGRFRHGYSGARGEVLIDRTLLLPLASEIAAHFERGETASLADLSRELVLPERAVERMLRPLIGGGLVHEVQGKAGTGYSLARPASEITAGEVLAASEALLPEAGAARRDGVVWQLMERIHRDLADRTGAVSLAELGRKQTNG